MSTTIEVYPVNTISICFGDVIHLAGKFINGFLDDAGISNTVTLHLNIHDIQEKYIREVNSSDLFFWKQNEYAWFKFGNIAGGSDVYCGPVIETHIDPSNPWWRLDEIISQNKTIRGLPEKIEKIKRLNHRWYFRRSAGQPAIVSVGYGLISAALAELTGGILWADDGAWDYEQFPAESAGFREWYFHPEKALKEENADWARRCMEEIKEDFLTQ